MHRIELLKSLCIEAGNIIKGYSSKTVTTKKGSQNFATEADLASEKFILENIKKYFPSDDILSEENDVKVKNPLESDNLWIIDPLDGTVNFKYGRNYSAVAIAFAQKGDIKIAGVYSIFSNELYIAEKGMGAFCNNQPLHSNELTTFSNATVATSSYYTPSTTKKHLAYFLKLSPLPFLQIKNSGALSVCDVASGKIDMFFHLEEEPWDNAAAFLIAEEAGAVIKDFKGNNATFMDRDVIVGNETLVKEFLKQINK